LTSAPDGSRWSPSHATYEYAANRKEKNFRLEDLISKEATVFLVKMRNVNVYY
jgi:hypothetical protein